MNRSVYVALVGVSVLGSLVAACGGGGGGDGEQDSRTVRFHGEVEEGVLPKSSNSPAYADYRVCTLGSCGVTDGTGEFEFRVSVPVDTTTLTFSLTGPAFTAQIPVQVPSSATDVDIEFVRDSSQNKVVAAEVKVDGVEDPGQGEGGFNDGD